MRERERPQRASRSTVDASSKDKARSVSKSRSTKPSTSKSSSSSSSVKKSSSSSSTVKKPTSSSSTTVKKPTSSSSSLSSKSQPSVKPPKASTSSSSKPHSSADLNIEKVPRSSSKSSSSGKDARSQRSTSRSRNTTQESHSKTSVKKDGDSRLDRREKPREEKNLGRRVEKGKPTSSREAENLRRSNRSDSKKEHKGDKKLEIQGRRRGASNAAGSVEGDPPSRSSSDRKSLSRTKSKETSNAKTKETSRTKSKETSSSEKNSKKSSKSDKERVKSSKEVRKPKEEDEGIGTLKTPSREKSAKRVSTAKKHAGEEKDSSSSIMGLVTGDPQNGHLELGAVEHNQNSLETMESGISISSPRDLSGDELDIEESISSKLVEVDEVADDIFQYEDEAMINDDASNNALMGESLPSEFHNSLEPSDFVTEHAGQSGVENKKPHASIDTTEHHVSNDVEDNDEYDYSEEEFEDYESDFEDDSGSGDEEDEESSSSSSFSSSSSSLLSSSEDSDDGGTNPDMEAVLQAMKKENEFSFPMKSDTITKEQPISPKKEKEDTVQEVKAATAEVKGERASTNEKPQFTNQRPKTSRTFVNFAGAKEKQEALHISSKMNSRGRTILSMIQLDSVNIDLLTLAPVSYEAYISSFGHSNRHQVNTQTNEDALSEEVQTEEIVLQNKWTQKPVHISIGKDKELPGPEDYMGVGGDIDPLTFKDLSKEKSNTSRLTSFLTSTSQVMLALLEEKLIWEIAETSDSNTSVSTEGLGFSQPPITLGTNVQSLLEGRTTPFVQFCPAEPSLLLSGHGFVALEEENMDECRDGGLLCVWWIQEPSRPQHLLSCSSSPTAASFSPSRPSLIIAGLEDGSLSTWDLQEPLHLHTLKYDIEGEKWRVRVPSYITACDENGGEGSPIVAIHTVTSEEDSEPETQGSFQVVTLTENGLITWWVVMHVPLTSAMADINFGRKSATTKSDNSSIAVSPNLGSSPWGKIAITKASTINVADALYGDEALSSEINCHDLKININDPSQLYVATGSGTVVHCSRHTSRVYPKAYYPDIEPGCEALCMDLCPHDYRYLLVGSSDGLVRLHHISSERPLTSWQTAPDCAPVKQIQWSPARPCVFYVLDSRARLHIWDLSAGDIFPMLTIEAGGLVGGSLSCFSIAPSKPTSRNPLYAVFASDVGEIVLRQVGPEFSSHQMQDDYNTELERFTYYVNII